MNPIKYVFQCSDNLTHTRSRSDIFTYATGEMGELAEEVGIANGFVNKPQGKDGVLGEAVDVIVCLLDLVRKEHPELSQDELVDIISATMINKTTKWVNKYQAD